MKLLLDENLSRRMVPHITLYYPESSQVVLLGLEHASDKTIWNYAREHDFVIVTKDYDFIDLSILYGSPPRVVLLKTGNQTWQATAQALIDCRELLASAFVNANVACI